MLNVLYVISLFVFSNAAYGKTVQISFTENDSYSIEVAHIEVGDTIEWLPKNEGHNVEFLKGPNNNALPKKSELNAFYSVTFDLPGLYVYQCTPHGNMGMLGLVVVGNDFHNLEDIEEMQLSWVAKSVLQRLIRIARVKKIE
tara:strand:- start:150 stop:575 length:426 start_codon:yes stop_codon:yes gene_type:complete